jgi:O-antigen/teichoic acid export membrane protein
MTNLLPAESSLRRIMSSFGILLLSQMLSALLAFFTYRLILSTFTKAEHGELFWVQQVGTLVLTCLVEAGMTTVTLGIIIRQQQIANLNTALNTTLNADSSADSSVEVIIATLFKLRLALWTAATLVLAGVGFLHSVDTVPLLVLWAVQCFFAGKIQLLRGVLELRRKSFSDQIPSALASIADSVLLLALVWLDREHLTTLSVLCWAVLSAIPGFVWLLLQDKQWRNLRLPFDAGIARQIFRESYPVLIVVLLQQAQDKADALFLNAFATPAELGVYGAGYRLVAQALVMVIAFAQAVYPTITRLHASEPERAQQAVFDATRAVMLLSIAFGLLASVAMPIIIHLSSGTAYMDNQQEFTLFVWATVLGFVQVFLLVINTAIGWQHRNYAVFGTLLAVSLLGNILLTPLYHVLGAIATKLLSNAFASGVALWVLRDLCGARRVGGLSLRYGAALVVSAGVAWGLVELTLPAAVGSSENLEIVLRFCLAMPIFVVVMMTAGLLTRKDLVFVRGALHSAFSIIARR